MSKFYAENTRNRNTSNRVRMSFTLPPSVQNDLSYVSARLNISKSAFLASLLEKPLPLFVSLLRQIPPEMVPNELAQSRVIKRYKNDSERVINEALDDLHKQIAFLTSQLADSPPPPSGESL